MPWRRHAQGGEQVQLVKWDEPTLTNLQRQTLLQPLSAMLGPALAQNSVAMAVSIEVQEEMIYCSHIWEMLQ